MLTAAVREVTAASGPPPLKAVLAGEVLMPADILALEVAAEVLVVVQRLRTRVTPEVQAVLQPQVRLTAKL